MTGVIERFAGAHGCISVIEFHGGASPKDRSGRWSGRSLLDLFCCAGGSGEGYRRAGFDVTGIDIEPQPNNPHRFIQADALEYLAEHGQEFDAIHASPPCQGYSNLRAMHPGKEYPMLIEPVREMLKNLGKPYIIENVEGAPLQRHSDLFGAHGVVLCGSMFGLGVERGFLRRHRIFETSFPVPQPQCRHRGNAVGVYGHGGHSGKHRMLYREEAARAMGIDWMNRDEMCQAIPPAYTEWLGSQLLRWMGGGGWGVESDATTKPRKYNRGSMRRAGDKRLRAQRLMNSLQTPAPACSPSASLTGYISVASNSHSASPKEWSGRSGVGGEIHIISLGAGVQSSMMALMAACGELTPMPAAAVFADTQAEPASVYKWLDWLETRLPFPVHRVSKGNLDEVATRVRTSKGGKNYTKSAIPAFIVDGAGKEGLLMRQCTSDFKIEVIQRKLRELRPDKKTQIVQWIGISADEWLRAKPSRLTYITNIWPLIERRITRQKCVEWMATHGYPKPPRSACVFCPYHSDAEWLRLKTEEPEAFARAVEFEKRYQTAMKQVSQFRGTPWLHRSHEPLEQVDFAADDTQHHFDFFGTDCEGMCGV